MLGFVKRKRKRKEKEKQSYPNKTTVSLPIIETQRSSNAQNANAQREKE
jgi:hypothetical protein